ncbi:MAG: hypothetical protein NZ840_06900 [Anaerolineales bacterium]|nr:hypothetical protein [Anaerolineales bacterium]MDW8161765.1 hypothetical protein [Anaerolineales bacterium]
MSSSNRSGRTFFSKLRGFDWLFVLFLVAFVTLFSIERIQWDYPHVFLGSDAANIVSFALAKNHPDWFAKDFLLSDRRNFEIYLQFHVLYTQVLERWIGDATLAFLSLLPVTVLLYLGGLYFFGRVFLGSPAWALAFTALNALPIYLPVDDIGIQTDPLPRTLFHSLLLFLLAGLWQWRAQPQRWLLLAVGFGGLVYIHAVSAPMWVLAFLASCLFLMPRAWTWRQRAEWLVKAGLILSVVLVPFVQNYLQNTFGGRTLPEGMSYAKFMEIFTSYYASPELHHPLSTAFSVLRILTEAGLIPLGVLGYIVGFSSPEQRQKLLLVLLWLAGVVGFSVVLPYFEQLLERRLQVLPLQTEFLRGIRFARWLISLLALSGLQLLQAKIGRPYASPLLLGLLLILTARMYYQPETLMLIRFPKTAECLLSQRRLLCQKSSPLRETLLFLRNHTPIDAAVFFAPKPTDTGALAVRYMAHRSLVYSWKDRGLGFARPEKLVEWHVAYSKLKRYKTSKRWLAKDPEQFLQFLKALGASHFIVMGSCLPEDDSIGNLRVGLVYKNSDYSVCRLD